VLEDADSAAELRLRAAQLPPHQREAAHHGSPTKILQHPCDWPLAHQRRWAGRSHIPRGEEGFTPSTYHAVEAETRLSVSKWQDEKAERNRRARTRLTKALPHIRLSAVLFHALSRSFVPPMPRLAIDSY
jgi:hypothetical protein